MYTYYCILHTLVLYYVVLITCIYIYHTCIYTGSAMFTLQGGCRSTLDPSILHHMSGIHIYTYTLITLY